MASIDSFINYPLLISSGLGLLILIFLLIIKIRNTAKVSFIYFVVTLIAVCGALYSYTTEQQIYFVFAILVSASLILLYSIIKAFDNPKKREEKKGNGARAYQSVNYALFQAGRISCQEPPQRRIPAEVWTIEEIWDILLMALPCHGRRFPLSGVNFWHPQTKARGWLQWLHGQSFLLFVCSLLHLSPWLNGIDKKK